MIHNWQYQTIEKLERQDYGNPDEAPTNMVRRCIELCRTPLNEFNVEDLRLMIGQNFALSYLIPLALQHLRDDIFVEGDYYPGDLLKNVLSVESDFWKKNKHLWEDIAELINRRREEIMLHKIPTELFDQALTVK